jgi:hypothetical protein
VYCTSVQKLISIPIWEQQRIYRPERAQLLAQDIKGKLSEGKPLTLPGVSCWLVEKRGEERGARSAIVVGGMHRD